MEQTVIKAAARTESGKGPARRLRAQGQVPGVIYQPEGPSVAFAADGHDLWLLLTRGEGRRSVVHIQIDEGPAVPAVFQEWQVDPVRGDIWHVDFKQIDESAVAETDARLQREYAQFAEERAAKIAAAATSRRAMRQAARLEAEAAAAAEEAGTAPPAAAESHSDEAGDADSGGGDEGEVEAGSDDESS